MTWIRDGVASRTRAGILPLYSEMVGKHLKCCFHFWVIQFRKNMEGLEHVQRRAAKMVRDVELKTCKEELRDLGMFFPEN